MWISKIMIIILFRFTLVRSVLRLYSFIRIINCIEIYYLIIISNIRTLELFNYFLYSQSSSDQIRNHFNIDLTGN